MCRFFFNLFKKLFSFSSKFGNIPANPKEKRNLALKFFKTCIITQENRKIILTSTTGLVAPSMLNRFSLLSTKKKIIKHTATISEAGQKITLNLEHPPPNLQEIEIIFTEEHLPTRHVGDEQENTILYSDAIIIQQKTALWA